MSIFCRCQRGSGGNQGFSNLGAPGHHWWVHAECGKPTIAFLEGSDSTMLNFFRGGSMDGNCYATNTLCEPDALALPITEYHWTPEVVVSAKTGAKARVWLHNSLRTPDKVDNVPGQSEAPETSSSTGGNNVSDIETRATGLVARRKELKLSRTPVSEASGFTVAQVARIETGGKRTTAEELDKLEATLNSLATAQASAAPAETPAAPAADVAPDAQPEADAQQA